MKSLIFILFLSWGSHAAELTLPPLTKTPKSLFLIKKAKIDNDVGEPVLYPSDKQLRLLTDEKIYNKYRLQIFDSKNR